MSVTHKVMFLIHENMFKEQVVETSVL